MANTRRQPPERISADCPHCGFSQLESAYAKSTFCRKCGEHYSIEKLLSKEAGSLKAPSLFERLGKMVSRETVRDINCFSCGAGQQVSSSAESSLCPRCGSYIDLRDFKITGPFGRSIQTQGQVVITSKGDVTSQRILCGSAQLEGKMRGQMICTGTVSITLQGKVLGGIDAAHVVIEKRSDIEFARPLKARSIEISGKVTAEIICDGRVTITKRGVLEGSVHARSIVVEKGGIFSGDLAIGATEGSEAAAPQPANEQLPGAFHAPAAQEWEEEEGAESAEAPEAQPADTTPGESEPEERAETEASPEGSEPPPGEPVPESVKDEAEADPNASAR